MRPEQRLGLGKGFRGHLVVAPDFAAELDHHRVRRVESSGALAMLDHVDHGGLDAFLQGFRLVRDPFELAVHLARGREDRKLAHPRREARLEAQIAIDGGHVGGDLRRVELHAGGPLQAGNGGARRGGAVVGLLPGFIEVFAFGQRQAETRLRVDVGRHGAPVSGKTVRGGRAALLAAWVGLGRATPLMRLARDTVRGMPGVTPSVLWAHVSDQRSRALALDFERRYERVFSIHKDVLRFPLELESDGELHRHLLIRMRGGCSVRGHSHRIGALRRSGDTPRVP